MHACWILLCMSLIILYYAYLINKEGIGMGKKFKYGLQGSIPQPMVGGVCYRLVSEPQVETPGRYGSGLLVRVSWLRLNSDREIENIKRNGIAESTQKIERHRFSLRVRRIMTGPFEFGRNHHCRIEGQVNKVRPIKRKQG